mmetsp:Transcript_22103/g.39665  ORF Transcript_22103/g.39665 Transcript_22103/m.39665 type:complete len:81 (-) Transcript_22103:130-372(-)
MEEVVVRRQKKNLQRLRSIENNELFSNSSSSVGKTTESCNTCGKHSEARLLAEVLPAGPEAVYLCNDCTENSEHSDNAAQ